MHRRAALIAVLSTGFAAACADMSMQHIQTKETILEDTLKNYAATIRWGDMLQAQAFVDPAFRQAHPMTDLDMQRYRQVQVTAYNDQPAAPLNELEVAQTVEIGLVNINTQAARSIIDHQVWRYDEKQKHWWLMTGLPNIQRQN
jgi:hypothetical protein